MSITQSDARQFNSTQPVDESELCLTVFTPSVRQHYLVDIVVNVVENVDDWSFDVFQINEAGDGHALKYVGYELLQKYNLINKFKVCVHTSSR